MNTRAINAEQRRIIENMMRLGWSEETATTVTMDTWPAIECVAKYTVDEVETCIYLITSPELATCTACAASGDGNDFHLGPSAISQTTIYVANCATPTHEHAKGFSLTEINPGIVIKTPVLAGATVVMELKILKVQSRKITMKIHGFLFENGKEIFEPRTLVLYRMPNKK